MIKTNLADADKFWPRKESGTNLKDLPQGIPLNSDFCDFPLNVNQIK